jgi:hypothetical protein
MSDRRDARDLVEQAEHAAAAGNFAAADELLRVAARIQEETLGPLHPDLANTFNNLAIVSERAGNLGDAEACYRRAVAIASASLPPEHPMSVASRENLESFCHARGVSIDPPAPLSPTADTDVGAETSITEQPRVPAGTPVVPQPTTGAAKAARGSQSIVWVAIAGVVLLAVLLVLRPWSSRNASAPPPADVVAPRQAPPPGPATIEPPAPSKTIPRRENQGVTDKNPAAPARGALTLVAAELCRSLSTNGPTWRCDRVDNSVAPGALVLYTRVRSARPDTVVHRWYHGGTLRQSVRLAIGANTSEGYRTYSRQTVRPGDWRVEVRTADDNLLDERRFSVK